jgi:hypothetical protein
VRFVVKKVALDWFFSKYFGFPVSLSFHQCCILIFIYTLLLPEGKMGEAWVTSKKSAVSEIGEHWLEKYFQLVSKGLT